MAATLLGIGQWLPETIRDNGAWPADFGRAGPAGAAPGRELAQIVAGDGDRFEQILLRRMSADEADPFRGTLRRRVAGDEVSSSEAEALAAKAALADARVSAEQVDFVLQSALVPDRLSPSNAPKVAHLIGARRAAALNVEAACASAVAQMEVAAALIESGHARHVLLTQSHLIARANPLTHPASPLLGDAATAIVMGRSERPGFIGAHLAAEGQFFDAVTWVRGRDVDPPWWREGGAFVAGTRDSAGTKLLLRAWVRYAEQTISQLLRRVNVPSSAVDVLASVQPRSWLPGAICEAIGRPDTIAPDTHAELAHVGTCGIVTNLIEARRRGLLRPGARVLCYGMGAGVNLAAALIEWTA